MAHLHLFDTAVYDYQLFSPLLPIYLALKPQNLFLKTVIALVLDFCFLHYSNEVHTVDNLSEPLPLSLSYSDDHPYS